MKILVTGLDGFLGTAIQRELLRVGHTVVGLSIGAAAGNVDWLHRCNTCDFSSVQRVFELERPEVCVHLAGLAHADLRPEDEGRARAVNVTGTENVARAAAAAGTSRLLFFSSAKVYGDSTSEEGLDETTAPAPGDIYGRLKLEAEERLTAIGGDTGLIVGFVRPVAVLGGGGRGNYARLIRAVRRGFFPLIDAGRARRSIVYVHRVATRVSRMVESGFEHGRAYVFSDGSYRVAEIMQAIRSACGPAIFLPVPALFSRLGSAILDQPWRIRGERGPFGKAVARLTESFVIRAHRFDEDYGCLLPFSLESAMAEACSSSVGASA